MGWTRYSGALRPYAAPGAVIAGSGLLFQVGAFQPVSAVYVRTDHEDRLSILRAHPVQWPVQQVLFATAAAALPVGVGMLAGRLGGRARGWAGLSAGMLAAGAVAWMPDLAHRVTDPHSFASRPTGREGGEQLPFRLFTLLSLGGLAALGMSVRSAGLARWLARVDLAAAAGLGAAYAATGDLPPFAWYAVATVDGVYLSRLTGHARARLSEPGAARVSDSGHGPGR